MSITVTRTKVIVPRRRPDILTRPRLTSLMDDLLDYRITLVTAPAGYGKTSLLVDFASQADFPVCWLALDPLDQDLYRFLIHLVASLRQQFPSFGGHSLSLIRSISQQEVDFDRLVRTIVNDAYEHIEEHFVVVLDDYHLIDQNQDINRFISAFGQEVDENCHLVIASRTLLDLPDLPLMVGRSQVKGLSFEELAFQPQEIQSLLEKNYQQEITTEKARDLASQTEGWITGLLLSAETMDDRTRAVRAAGIDLYDYLADQVLDRQPRLIQNFLLTTSPLGEFNADLCQAILGDPPEDHSWLEMINTVLHNNLFVIPVETGGTWIRYHHLFSNFLRNRYKKERPAERQQLLRRVIEHYLSEQKWDQAYQFGQKLGDQELIAELIEKAGAPLMKEGRIKLLSKWIDQLPDHVLAHHPALLSRFGAVSIILGKPNQGLSYLKQSETLTEGDDSALELARNLVWQASAQRFLGEYTSSLNLAQQALATIRTLPEQLRIRAQALKAAGLAHFRLGETDRALSRLVEANSIYRELQDDRDAAQVAMDLGLVTMQHGAYDQSSRFFQTALSMWQAADSITHQAGLYNNLGVLEHLRGNFREAHDYFQGALTRAQQSGYLRMEAFTQASLGDLYADLEALTTAREHYDLALELAQEIEDRYLIRYLELMNAKLNRLNGDFHQSHLMLNAIERETQESGTPQELGLWHLEKGQLHLAEHDRAEALQSFHEAENRFSSSGSRLEQIRAALLLALTSIQLGDRADARKHAQRGLDKASQLDSPHPLIYILRDKISLFADLELSPSHRKQLDELRAELRTFENQSAEVLQEIIPDEAAPDPQAPRWEITVFGRPQVLIRGNRVQASEWVNQKSARDLLYLLVTDQTGKTKAEIGAALWPESSAEELRTKFKNAVYRLRRALGKELVLYQSQTRLYLLNRSLSLKIDLDAFCEALDRVGTSANPADREEALVEALNHYQHPFLGGNHSLWVEPIRTELFLKFKKAALDLAEIYFHQDQFAQTLEITYRLLDIDPCLESACRMAMKVHAAQGNRSAVARQYQRCREAFSRLLDTHPSPETEALYQQLLG